MTVESNKGSPEQPSYLILGAGTFGASAALHLIRCYPSAQVTIVDQTQFPCAAAAGHDLNKIIRAEYEDPFYMKLAMEAQEIWRQDPIFRPFYHETGLLFAGVEGPGQTVIDNYKKVVGYSPAELISPQEAISRFDGIFRETDWEGVTHCIWNPMAGWGEAENALNSVIQTAVDLGVEYQIATAAKLLFTPDDHCSGILTTEGETLTADRVVVCTGAYTASLFADSAPETPELQVDGRMVAAAAIMGAFRVPEDQVEKYETAPIIVQPMNKRPGESIPPGALNLVKCTHELSFTNKQLHQASGQVISIPPKAMSQQTWSQDVPAQLKDEVEDVRISIYGDWIERLEPEYYRMCWDAVTPNQDFIISPHPFSDNLFVCGGGSFHGWKFLPNIGSYIVKMLDGNLDEVALRKWAWDRSDDGAACANYIPSRDLGDIVGSQAA